MCKGSSDFEPVYDLAGEELLCSGVIAGVDVSSFSERGQFSINLEDTQRLNTPVRLELKVLRVPDQKLITLLARNNYKNQWHNFLSGCRLRDLSAFLHRAVLEVAWEEGGDDRSSYLSITFIHKQMFGRMPEIQRRIITHAHVFEALDVWYKLSSYSFRKGWISLKACQKLRPGELERYVEDFLPNVRVA